MAKRVAVLGIEDKAGRLAGMLRTRASRFELVGRIQPFGEATGSSNGVALLGSAQDLEAIIDSHKLDYVVVASDGFSAAQYDRLSRVCRSMSVKLYRTADIFGTATGDLMVVDGLPLVGIESIELPVRSRMLKRLLDLALGTVFGLLILPLLGLIALAVKIESPGPVLFHQIRRGKGGRHFRMRKFRSMVTNADMDRDSLEQHNESGGLLFKMRSDPRVTKVGRILRRWSLDELPQFYHVFLGEMSLVGPRPLPLRDVEAHIDDPNLRHWIERREEVIPGITGLWQVRGRSDVGFEEMLALDMHYVKNWSLALDLTILAKTIPAILLGRGAY